MKRKKKGMTLIEVMASLAMFAIIGSAIVATISTAFTFNARNRAKANSNANSRAFFELLKSEKYKPEEYNGTDGIETGYYYISYKNDSDLESAVQNLSTYKISGGSNDFYTVKESASIRSDDKYLMSIYVEWVSAEKIYKVDVWSWEISKGSNSEVMRRALIAPK